MRQNKDAGFTIIEVSLATVYVGIIIMMLSATTINIMKQYNKGVWLSQISQAGQQLNEDIGETARYSSTITSTKIATLNGGESGRLCVGNVTYAWNTEKAIDEDKNGDYGNNGAFSLMRFDDVGGNYCDCSGNNCRSSRSLPNVEDSGGIDSKIILSKNAVIQEFKPIIEGNILSLKTVISTKGDGNKPKNVGGQWMCGNWTDTNGDGKGDRFEESKNQFCAFADYDITVYERSAE